MTSIADLVASARSVSLPALPEPGDSYVAAGAAELALGRTSLDSTLSWRVETDGVMTEAFLAEERDAAHRNWLWRSER